MKSNDFINEDILSDVHEMHTDHEVQMAREEVYHTAENAIALHKLLKHISERQGLEAWVSEKIALANDYLKTVREYLEYELMSAHEQENAIPTFNIESAEQEFENILSENASAGATGAGSVASVTGELGGKVSDGKPKKVSNVIKRTPAVKLGKGIY